MIFKPNVILLACSFHSENEHRGWGGGGRCIGLKGNVEENNTGFP